MSDQPTPEQLDERVAIVVIVKSSGTDRRDAHNVARQAVADGLARSVVGVDGTVLGVLPVQHPALGAVNVEVEAVATIGGALRSGMLTMQPAEVTR